MSPCFRPYVTGRWECRFSNFAEFNASNWEQEGKMKINRIYRNAARLIAVTAIVTVPGFAFALTCRAGAGGPAFSPSDVREVTAAAVQARGAEQCDVVYHVDGKRFDLGGCD
jgi:hypothetical protein